MTREPIDDHAHYNNLLVRTQLLARFARSEKCRISCVSFYPVEVKSDDDTLDECLPNQIIDAILEFGLSILVLDRNPSKKARGLGRLLPTTIICYTGSTTTLRSSQSMTALSRPALLICTREAL